MKIKKILGGFMSIAVLIVVATSAFALSETVMVSGDSLPWLFNRDTSTTTPFEFNTDAATTGIGSLYVLPIQNTYPVLGKEGNDKFIAENFIMQPIADVESISYDFRIGSGGVEADKVHFYMNVYANFGESPDDKYYDCRYNVVPTVGSTSDFTTVTFDPTQAYPVTTRTGGEASPYACPPVPADMDTLSEGSNIRMFALNLGDTSVNDQDLDGYFDTVVVALNNGDMTTYDFEPALTPESADECKNDGWMSFNSPTFKNQGDCVSYVKSNANAVGNKTK